MKTFIDNVFSGEIKEGDTVDLHLDRSIYDSPDRFMEESAILSNRINNLKKELTKRANALEQEIVSWNYQYNQIKKQVSATKSDIGDRLFLRSDSEGFFKTFEDSFFDDSRIDYQNEKFSNVEFGKEQEAVMLKAKQGNRKISSNLMRTSVSITRPAGGALIPYAGSNLSNIHRKETAGYLASCTNSNGNLPEINFVFDFTTEQKVAEINFHSSSLYCLYSVIAIEANGNPIQIERDLVVTNSNTVLVDKTVKTIQISIRKINYDQAEGEDRKYIFNLQDVSFFKKGEVFERAGTYVSKPYTAYGITKAAIEVCDFNTEDTSIQYFIEAKEIASSPPVIYRTAIRPLNKAPDGSPSVLKLSNQSLVNNVTGPFFNPINPEVPETAIIDLQNSIDTYRFADGVNVVNSKIKPGIDNLNTLQVFGDLKVNSSFSYMEEGNNYTCWVYINGSEGNELFVANTGIYIVGLIKENQKITLDKTGWFKVVIPAANFHDAGSTFSDKDELKNLDPLFPYNGKYLVEGTNLGIPEYKGFSKIAKKKLEPAVGLDNLKENGYYLSRIQAENFIILLSKDNEAKNCYYEYIGANIGGYEISLIANLKTLDGTISPIFASYKIKVGQ